jgi:dipeptidyl aminopeptidase/acylaminoacyl peptidase
VYIGSLDSGDSTRLVSASSGAQYDAESRLLLFVRRGTLMAQDFDVRSLALTGEPFPVTEGVEASVVPGVTAFSLSGTGVLVYGIGSAEGEGHRLSWVDRQGRAVGDAVGPLARYYGISVSADGSQLAAHRHDGTGGDIWVTDLSRNRTSRLTFQAEHENASPVWSPDGSRIAFGSIRGGKPGVYVKASDNTGEEELLHEVSNSRFATPHSWSPDGTFVLFGVASTDTGRDLWTVAVTGERTAAPLQRSAFSESQGQISPDGRWLAYVTDETGAFEIYVRPASGTGGKWAVSSGGGRAPRWRGDSRELFYLSSSHLMAVDVTSAGPAFVAGEPRELFSVSDLALGAGHSDHFAYAAAADGQRFLLTRRGSVATAAASPIVIVFDWAAGSRRE